MASQVIAITILFHIFFGSGDFVFFISKHARYTGLFTNYFCYILICRIKQISNLVE